MLSVCYYRIKCDIFNDAINKLGSAEGTIRMTELIYILIRKPWLVSDIFSFSQSTNLSKHDIQTPQLISILRLKKRLSINVPVLIINNGQYFKYCAECLWFGINNFYPIWTFLNNTFSLLSMHIVPIRFSHGFFFVSHEA